MTHVDPDVLALAALGEQLAPADADHLATCAQCQQEVAELVAMVTLAREAPPSLTPAPDAVWDAIQAELGLAAAPDGSSRAQPGVLPSESFATAADQGARATDGHDGGGQVVRLQPRRRLLGVAAIAAAVGAIVGGTVVWAAMDQTAEQPLQGRVIAQAVLEPLSPAVTGPGKAQVLQTSDGLVVRVDARSLPPRSGFHEVWLLDTDATKLVALGALPSGSVGTFTVPPGVQLRDFPVVDISLEPYDGNPAHSHDSLLRGILEA